MTVPATLLGRPLALRVTPGDVTVLTEKGEPLDPAAAEVIMALGGAEPEWLRPVEGLRAAHRAGATAQDLARIAPRLTTAPRRRGPEAARTKDVLLLTALAGAGEPNAARNALLTPYAWDLLGDHRDPFVRRNALGRTATLPPALAGHRDPEVRLRVAANRGCPPAVLTSLAADPDGLVAAAVAGNEAAPPEALALVARRDVPGTGPALARHPGTPAATLRRLAKAADAESRIAAAGNPRLPRTVLWRMFLDTDWRVLDALARRGDLGPRALGMLERTARTSGHDGYRLVRWRLAQHPNAPKGLRRRLARMERWDTGEVPAHDASVRRVLAVLGSAFALAVLALLGSLAGLVRGNGAGAAPALAVTAVVLGGLLARGYRPRLKRFGPDFVLAVPRVRQLVAGAVALPFAVGFVIALPAVWFLPVLAYAGLMLYLLAIPRVQREGPPRGNGRVARGWQLALLVSVVVRVVNSTMHFDETDPPRPSTVATLPADLADSPYTVLYTPLASRVANHVVKPIAPTMLAEARRDAQSLAAACARAWDELLRTRGVTASEQAKAVYGPLRQELLRAAAARTPAEWDARAPRVLAELDRARTRIGEFL